MSEHPTASQRISEAVGAWPGVEVGSGDPGETEFTIDGHEIGHLHGDRAAHFGFPKEVGAALREQGRVGPHPVNPRTTRWAARRIDTDDDARDVIELLRLNYDRIVQQRGEQAGV